MIDAIYRTWYQVFSRLHFILLGNYHIMFQVPLVTAKNITKTRVLFELRIGTAGLQYKYKYITVSLYRVPICPTRTQFTTLFHCNSLTLLSHYDVLHVLNRNSNRPLWRSNKSTLDDMIQFVVWRRIISRNLQCLQFESCK